MVILREIGRGDTVVGESSNMHISRQQVKALLEVFRTRVDEFKNRKAKNEKRADTSAFTKFREEGLVLNTVKMIGAIPGIEIGDKFQYRTELVLIGIHHKHINGIDHLCTDGIHLATSIVASGHYSDKMELSDELIYSGEGSNPTFHSDTPPEDQKLESGNLALKNSMDCGTPVRVIRQQNCKSSRISGIRDGHAEKTSTFYVYDGLYKVAKYWQERGDSGKLVFQFKLKRIEGQPSLLGRKPNSYASRKRALLMDDISEGKEEKAITLVNTFDYEKLPQFSYISNVRSQKMYNQCRPQGCHCMDGCSDSEDCSCKVKNGGKTPYDYSERIISLMPAIYECGPPCKCFQSCLNRVCQRGIKFQLEVFRTESRQWGVRSRDYVPKGRFICEYVGEFLQGRKAEQRSIKAEYFFNIGDKCIIDATQFGNVGRFIRRNSTPNLYAKRVFYGYGIPHIVFFAMKNIPPLRELTCDHSLA